MARNATLKILITYKAYEGFTVLIRPQETSERRAAQLEWASDNERGFGGSGNLKQELTKQHLMVEPKFQNPALVAR